MDTILTKKKKNYEGWYVFKYLSMSTRMVTDHANRWQEGELFGISFVIVYLMTISFCLVVWLYDELNNMLFFFSMADYDFSILLAPKSLYFCASSNSALVYKLFTWLWFWCCLIVDIITWSWSYCCSDW